MPPASRRSLSSTTGKVVRGAPILPCSTLDSKYVGRGIKWKAENVTKQSPSGFQGNYRAENRLQLRGLLELGI